jgi:hypothetical protein
MTSVSKMNLNIISIIISYHMQCQSIHQTIAEKTFPALALGKHSLLKLGTPGLGGFKLTL